MPMIDAPIRNVRFDPCAPISEWSVEVVETVLDRGSLSDWHLLAAEIRRQPWGNIARQVAEIISWGEHYGVDQLMSTIIERARQRFDDDARQRYAAQLRQRRLDAGLAQRELAQAAGTSASRLSAYENGTVAPTTTVLGRIEAVIDAHIDDRAASARP